MSPFAKPVKRLAVKIPPFVDGVNGNAFHPPPVPYLYSTCTWFDGGKGGDGLVIITTIF